MALQRQTRSKKSQANIAEDREDTHHSVLGGLKGGYRVDGTGSAQLEDSSATLTTSSVEQYNIPFNDKSIVCERRGEAGRPALIFTHGAGGGLANPATSEFANGFAEKASIVSFQGTMNLQSRIKTFHAVMLHEKFDTALGGRSMGARAAATAAIEENHSTKALVMVSFPLVGGKNKESREQTLLDLPKDVDVLFVSGSKDAQCDLTDLNDVMSKMDARSWLICVEEADHSMSWKAKSSVQEMRRLTGRLGAEWLCDRDVNTRRCTISWNEEAAEIHCSGWVPDAEAFKKDGEDIEPRRKKQKRK
ncbi:hypothetical protein KC332_g7143 [Hortaea werneckii]|uniref:KANL3/Tex30 alpha/beta hydrolase-like domain-containing protein n=2 Tax=Hortaea werneckii TaxID=91943 RepID=A0A3M7GYK8_HORWE|nr:hypothetical protein KC350_g16101 [Hortaea werneckii]OTA30348.1 hypothetical protein BTJ68_09330 [Hortaea werneckii EXF-2000]KAI6841868.1 hypothetical protein KC358_g4112 [Hortaea werneckii]KAI6937385.1 hypothetical protein KC341_g5611 [Hortaea werneckii]KAI6943495.1 hypothetical protein KC348_g4242 [Hortaea werneckii]